MWIITPNTRINHIHKNKTYKAERRTFCRPNKVPIYTSILIAFVHIFQAASYQKLISGVPF